MDAEKTKLVEDNMRLVYHLFKNFGENKFINQNKDDFISEGMIGLIKAAKSYNAEKKIKFATYAARCIFNEMLMYLRCCKKWKNDISLYSVINTNSDGDELYLIDFLEDKTNRVEDCTETMLLNSLWKNFVLSQKIMCQKMLVLRDEGLKQRQIADCLGLSQSYVSRVLNKIKRQFKAMLA